MGIVVVGDILCHGKCKATGVESVMCVTRPCSVAEDQVKADGLEADIGV